MRGGQPARAAAQMWASPPQMLEISTEAAVHGLGKGRSDETRALVV